MISLLQEMRMNICSVNIYVGDRAIVAETQANADLNTACCSKTTQAKGREYKLST